MWKNLLLVLVLVQVSGCYRPCTDGNCGDKVLVESASRHHCGPGCEHLDLVVYCDGRYKYQCLDCEPYAGKLETQLLDELKQAVTNPFKFNHADGIAHYWYREDDMEHRGRDSSMAALYQFVEGQYLSEPNQVMATLAVLKVGMTEAEVKSLIEHTQQAMVIRPMSDANNVLVLYYCPAGCQTAAQTTFEVFILSALAGGKKDDKLVKAAFQMSLYRELTSKKNIPLVFSDEKFVGWGWDVYDQYVPRQRILDEMFTPEQKEFLEKNSR